MTMIESLAREFGHEAQTTRRHLERLPAERLDWRPHHKSFTLRALGSHIADCVRWGDSIFGGDELDLDAVPYEPFAAGSVGELLETFDRHVARCTELLARTTDASLSEPWRLRMMGRVRVEKPKADVFRDFTLSHLIHHRGQLSVYLRLLDVPVPGSYGPTADE
jgi:uncharacterized damage-inducible protein DinB